LFVLAWAIVIEAPILPISTQIGILRTVPHGARESFVEYVLADKPGLFRGSAEKRSIVLAISQADQEGKPLLSRYETLIPYSGYYMSKKYGVVTETPEGERTPEAMRTIMAQNKADLVQKTFEFHTHDSESMGALCSQLYADRFPKQFEQFCKGRFGPSGQPIVSVR